MATTPSATRPAMPCWRTWDEAAASAASYGEAYRLGGDEFCAAVTVEEDAPEEVMAGASLALSESGDESSVRRIRRPPGRRGVQRL